MRWLVEAGKNGSIESARADSARTIGGDVVDFQVFYVDTKGSLLFSRQSSEWTASVHRWEHSQVRRFFDVVTDRHRQSLYYGVRDAVSRSLSSPTVLSKIRQSAIGVIVDRLELE